MTTTRKPRTVWVIALNYRAIWAYYDKKQAQEDWRKAKLIECAELIECVEVIRKKKKQKRKVSP